jgi:hypothetical protein
MSSFKKLNKADVTTVSYAANKRWSFVYSSSLLNNTGSEITVYRSQKDTFNVTGSTTTNGQYQSLIHAQLNHLFYQSYSGSLLDTGSLKFNITTYISASQNRPTASYFNYNTNPLLVKNFPTGNLGDPINVINVSQKIFGSKILPTSLLISSSTTYITDDGNGNLYDSAGIIDEYIALSYISSSYFLSGSIDSGIVHVGNIFYAHGLIVFTNTESKYDGLFTTAITNSISFQNEHIVYENEVRCIVKESDYNLSYNPTLIKYGGQYMTLVSGSTSPSGSRYKVTGSIDSTLKDFATGSDFHPYATTIGLYNDEDELLMVAKLGKPMMISPDTDMTFIVKYDN